MILHQIEVQLRHEPDVPTGKRKELEEHPISSWELRLGDFRAFYDCDHDKNEVVINAIGEKIHNRLLIGGREVVL